MALYGIALLPLAEILRKEFPKVMQPWYADDAAMNGSASDVAPCFEKLIKVGPMFGYHPEPEKSWCVSPLASEAPAKAAFAAADLKVKYCRGQRYVGGFVGSGAMEGR